MEFDKYIPELEELLAKLPLISELVKLQSINRFEIYGGILRFFYSYTFKNEKTPSFEELLEYLKTGDIDIKIKSYNSPKILMIIQKLVLREEGTIEYLGSDYHCCVIKESISQLPKEITSFDPRKICYKGCYGIWIPNKFTNDNSKIKYEIFLSDYAAIDYPIDFTVNSLTLKLPEAIVTDKSTKTIEHLREKKLVTVFDETVDSYNLIKKIYRSKKLFDKGYTFAEPDKIRKILANIEKILSQENIVLFENSYAPCENTNKDLIICAQANTITFDLNSWRSLMKDIYQAVNF